MINNLLVEKKGWLDKLFYKVGKQNFDFFVAGTYIDKKGEKQFTKWKKYLDAVATIDVLDLSKNDWKDLSFFKQINQRQILPHEIVLDIEEPENLKPIIEKIKDFGWEGDDVVVFKTGSRGYHIHLYLHRPMSIGEKEAVVLKMGTDIQKCSEKNLIALEYCPHWKTGKLKQEVKIWV